MSGKRTSFSMGNEFNGYAGATYLKGTDRQSYPLLSQTDVRVLTSLDSLVVMALGAIPVYIDANQADLDMSMAVGAIPQVNMVQVTYDEKTGTTNQTFQVASSGVSTGSYFQGYSNNNNANIVEITPIGWLLFGTAGWKWGEGTGTKKEGWLEDLGKWYYFRNEWMVTGWQLITYKGKSHWFYFNTKKDRQGVERAGDMVIGWIELNYNGENHWFYFHGNGTMAVDTWIDYRAKDGNWYYCGSDGTMRKSQLRVGNDGNLYYLKDDGAMAVSETIVDKDSGKTYYANEDGVLKEQATKGLKVANSPLVVYTQISPNSTNPRNHVIDTITIHCMAGNLSIETCGNVFAPSSAGASSNYGVGTDGRIGMYVEEKNRSWCSSSASNDHRAITIEVANNGGQPDWPVSDKAYAALLDLVTDICKRNDIKRLLWKGDKSLIGQVGKQNMTVHRWFAAKACPGDYLYNLHSDIAEKVNKRL